MVTYIKVKSGSHSVISDSCNPMDCSLPGSSVHGILQTRIPEWVDYPFSRGSSWPRNQTGVSCITGRFFTSWATREEVIYICQRYSLKSSHPCLLPISKFKVHHNGLIYVYIIKYIYTYIYIFLIHSPIDRHRLSPCPGYTATINMVYWYLFRMVILFSSEICPEVESLDHTVVLFLIFWCGEKDTIVPCWWECKLVQSGWKKRVCRFH